MKINQEHVIGLVCLAVSGVILSITPGFPKGKATVGLTGPAFFPNLLSIVFILCGLYQISLGSALLSRYQPISGGMIKTMFRNKETRTAYFIILLMVCFILLFDFLGFILTTLLFLGFFMKRLGVSTPKTVLYSFIFTTTIYFLFGWLFTISLPSGLLSYIGL